MHYTLKLQRLFPSCVLYRAFLSICMRSNSLSIWTTFCISWLLYCEKESEAVAKLFCVQSIWRSIFAKRISCNKNCSLLIIFSHPVLLQNNERAFNKEREKLRARMHKMRRSDIFGIDILNLHEQQLKNRLQV